MKTDTTPLSVRLPGASTSIAIPMGWTLAPDTNALALVGPEGDLEVAYVAVANKGDAPSIATAAWRLLDPAFDRPIAQHVEAPSNDGWDLANEIIYRTNAAEGRVVAASVRALRERAYVALIAGSKAAFSRREAQLGEMIEAWKPDGLVAMSLADRTAAIWSKQHSDLLGRFVREAMDTMRIPGVAIAIVQAGKVVHADGFGVCMTGGAQPVAPDTRFMIGSTTKPLTSLMMARLIDRGSLAWSTPITDLLPDFALADPGLTRRLQLQHTVSASTGMPRRDVELVFRYRGISPEERLAEMKQMQPTTGFGEVFQYSNYLVAAGGYAAARSFAHECPLGSAYEQAMQQLVFDPLGMTHTTLHQEEACRDRAAAPHAIDVDGKPALIDLDMERFGEAVAPAGAIWSTALDMAKYLLLELNGGKDAHGEPLLSTCLLESRRSGGIKIDGKTSYGLGLVCADEQGLQVIGHGGSTLGFSSDMYFLPANDLGVVVLTNLRLANTFLAALRQKFFELVFGAAPLAEKTIAGAAKALEHAIATVRDRVKVDPDSVAWLDGLRGEYHCKELGSARISHRDDRYSAQFDGWGSVLGSETQSDGKRVVVLICPPWSGALRLQVSDDGQQLLLDGGQTKYAFVKADEPAKTLSD